jgi:hypothetical protein
MYMGADHQGPMRCSLARWKLLVARCVGGRDDKRDVKMRVEDLHLESHRNTITSTPAIGPGIFPGANMAPARSFHGMTG